MTAATAARRSRSSPGTREESERLIASDMIQFRKRHRAFLMTSLKMLLTVGLKRACQQIQVR
jgi:hypothetical protein